MADVLLVLFVLPLGILSPFPAGINALFSHGPRRSAGLARVYALWNITSLVNVVSTQILEDSAIAFATIILSAIVYLVLSSVYRISLPLYLHSPYNLLPYMFRLWL
jgi:hypothetical protein